MALTSSKVLYGPFNLSLKSATPTEIYGLTGLRPDALKFTVETKEGSIVLEDGSEKFWKEGRKLTAEIVATQLDAKHGTITAVADAGGGKITITSASHGLANGDYVTISGTASYDGWYLVSNVAENTFQVTKTYVSSQTGAWARSIHTDIERSEIVTVEIYLREKDKTITIANPDSIKVNLEENFKMRIVIQKTGDLTQFMSDLMSVA